MYYFPHLLACDENQSINIYQILTIEKHRYFLNVYDKKTTSMSKSKKAALLSQQAVLCHHLELTCLLCSPPADLLVQARFHRL